jgi:hypothetical protein
LRALGPNDGFSGTQTTDVFTPGKSYRIFHTGALGDNMWPSAISSTFIFLLDHGGGFSDPRCCFASNRDRSWHPMGESAIRASELATNQCCNSHATHSHVYRDFFVATRRAEALALERALARTDWPLAGATHSGRFDLHAGASREIMKDHYQHGSRSRDRFQNPPPEK